MSHPLSTHDEERELPEDIDLHEGFGEGGEDMEFHEIEDNENEDE